MASFLPNLWESIFTSGPTPTLLLATNVTFASLQLVLLLLLLATYSVHFVILSVLCGGLWYAINWFAGEVAAVRAEERRKEEEEDKKKRGKDGDGVKGGDGHSADDEGESTEVEGEGLETSRGSLSLSGFEEGAVRTGREGEQEQKGLRARTGRSGDLSGEVSTDSEWEKVEDGR